MHTTFICSSECVFVTYYQVFSSYNNSVSNLGMYGISEFTAIINPPQAAILAVGGVRLVPWVTDEGEQGVVRLMTATLSHDCRVIDYELAAKWLTLFKNFLESPSILELL